MEKWARYLKRDQMGMLLVQLTRGVVHLKSNVILRRDTIVDLPDAFNSRIAQFRMEDNKNGNVLLSIHFRPVPASRV